MNQYEIDVLSSEYVPLTKHQYTLNMLMIPCWNCGRLILKENTTCPKCWCDTIH